MLRVAGDLALREPPPPLLAKPKVPQEECQWLDWNEKGRG